MSALPRFRFGDFVVSPRQRVLARAGREVPLIPRYFDLLVLLLARRHEAVHREVIFSSVWSDVVVSDGALTQAVRALRRALEDDSREPRFIRTVSRHGYRFVGADVVEEADEGPLRIPGPAGAATPPPAAVTGVVPGGPATEDADAQLDFWIERLCAPGSSDEERREAAERLHGIGTARAIARIGAREGSAAGLALLRDARWDVPGSGPVPLAGQAGPGAVAALVRVRLRALWRQAGRRWLSAAAGAAVAGAITGAIGAACLVMLPETSTPPTAVAVLAALGALAGACGGAGVGGGLCAAEVLARSARSPALVAGGAAGGALVGGAGRLLVLWTLEGLFGLRPPIGGPIEGAALGAAAGLGYAWATAGLADGGLAAPRGRGRLRVAGAVALACACAALGLGAAGRPMVGGLVNAIAHATRQSQLSFVPLSRFVGEPEFGPLTGAAVGAIEGAAFGAGLAIGLARRPRRA